MTVDELITRLTTWSTEGWGHIPVRVGSVLEGHEDHEDLVEDVAMQEGGVPYVLLSTRL